MTSSCPTESSPWHVGWLSTRLQQRTPCVSRLSFLPLVGRVTRLRGVCQVKIGGQLSRGGTIKASSVSNSGTSATGSRAANTGGTTSSSGMRGGGAASTPSLGQSLLDDIVFAPADGSSSGLKSVSSQRHGKQLVVLQDCVVQSSTSLMRDLIALAIQRNQTVLLVSALRTASDLLRWYWGHRHRRNHTGRRLHRRCRHDQDGPPADRPRSLAAFVTQRQRHQDDGGHRLAQRHRTFRGRRQRRSDGQSAGARDAEPCWCIVPRDRRIADGRCRDLYPCSFAVESAFCVDLGICLCDLLVDGRDGALGNDPRTRAAASHLSSSTDSSRRPPTLVYDVR